MRVILCDDHVLFAEALASTLRARGHEVVAILDRPDGLADHVRDIRADAVVLDMAFGAVTGLDALAESVASAPHVPVLVLSGRDDPATIRACLDAGASAYASKGQPVAAVVAALERLVAGEPADLPRLPGRRPPARSAAERSPFSALTPQERRVLALLARGASTADLAREMGVTTSTARSHVQNLLVKLQVHSRVEAVALAAATGLLADAAGDTGESPPPPGATS